MSTHDQSLTSTSPFKLPVIPKRQMTEEDFVAWCLREDIHAEWKNGDVSIMSPVSAEHAELFLWLGRLLGDFVENCELGIVLGSELFVRLSEGPSRRLPDIFFVSTARRELLRKSHFEGPPDMIMEIVSPESISRDWRVKYLEYEAAGVPEYWVIDPMSQRVEIYVLSASQRYERVAERDGWLFSIAVPGFRLKIDWLWPATRPKAIDALAELNALLN
jgi:Uma2 family endonuclease